MPAPAQHQTAFYGLLAAEKAGLAMEPGLTGAETFPGYRRPPSGATPAMQARAAALAAGERYLARRFVGASLREPRHRPASAS